MSTTVETNKVTFTGNGSTTVFPFTFRVFTAADIEVYLDGVLQTLTTHYSVTIDPSVEGGSVTFVTAPASSVVVLIKRVVDFTQPSRFPTEGRLPESTFENAVDRATMLLVQLKEILSRVPALAVTSSFSDLLLPEPSAGKAIGWNDAGTNLTNLTLVQTTVAYSGTISKGTDASKPASPSQGDIYFATDTNTLYKCVVGGVWNAVAESSKGANIASATTTAIWATDGDYVHITGTTTITGFGTALKAGAMRTLIFDGALTLTHHATNLIIPGGTNITTAAGDRAIVRAETTTTARVIAYIRADGKMPIGTCPKNYIDGGILSNNGTDAVNDIDITATLCRSDDDTEDISVIAMTKRIDAAWTAGTNQGMMDTSTIGAAEDLIYFYAIKNLSTGATDYVATKTYGSPTMPSGYTKKRFIGARRWDGAAWSKFWTHGDGRVLDVFYDDASDADMTALSSGTATSFTDIDCGDGGAELIPSSGQEAYFTIDLRSNSVNNPMVHFRRNGAAQAIHGSCMGAYYEPMGSTTPRIKNCLKIPVDTNGIFEYTMGAATSEVTVYINGFVEVR